MGFWNHNSPTLHQPRGSNEGSEKTRGSSCSCSRMCHCWFGRNQWFQLYAAINVGYLLRNNVSVAETMMMLDFCRRVPHAAFVSSTRTWCKHCGSSLVDGGCVERTMLANAPMLILFSEHIRTMLSSGFIVGWPIQAPSVRTVDFETTGCRPGIWCKNWYGRRALWAQNFLPGWNNWHGALNCDDGIPWYSIARFGFAEDN